MKLKTRGDELSPSRTEELDWERMVVYRRASFFLLAEVSYLLKNPLSYGPALPLPSSLLPLPSSLFPPSSLLTS
jgi:hypothetical protein